MISIAELRIAFILRVQAIWSAAFNRSLVEIPPNRRISDFMRYLKGKSTMIIFEVQIWKQTFWV